MGKIIQIRGCSGSGKTFFILWLINHYNLKRHICRISGSDIVYYCSDSYSRMVIGDYDSCNGQKACVGLDQCRVNSDGIINIILTLIRRFNPEYIYFEKMILGVTTEFAKKIARYAFVIGYQYIGVLFLRDYSKCYDAILNRNGGKLINDDNLYKNYCQAIKSYNKLNSLGYICLQVDIDSCPSIDIDRKIICL